MAQCSRCGSDCWDGKPCNCKNQAPLIRPQHGVCEGCSDWDDINGCWAGHSEWCGNEHGVSEDDYENVTERFTYLLTIGRPRKR